MKYLEIKRVATGPQGTFGVLLYKDTPFALTLEPEWRNNKPFESCIPAGTYICVRVMAKRWGNTFLVSNVHGRTDILFHAGNVEDNTEGCILVGEEFGKLGSSDGILSSAKGFSEFMDILEREPSFNLRIVDHFRHGTGGRR